jgi:hydroxylamine dehydrogenase
MGKAVSIAWTVIKRIRVTKTVLIIVEIGDDGKPTPGTWPNTGIGRINPDGSNGSCTACHGRHRFSKAQARTPDTCGKCHVGPDHPQIEVYNESKHGIIYRAKVDEMQVRIII